MSAPAHETQAESNVMVPLRDGVRLATDIYFPEGKGDRHILPKTAGQNEPVPVVLIRTPYDKTGHSGTGKYYAERGYVAAMQDVRGRYRSEGVFYPFAHEAPDGYDTVEWLAAQPWCNGKVGTFGQSYEAAVQSALATLRPPHLAAMIVTYGPSSYYHSSMRHNGALELRFIVYAFTMAATSKEAMADPQIKAALDEACANIWDWLKAGPIRRGCTPLRLVPSYEQWCLDILTHAKYDDYWKQRGYGPLPYYDEHADVPTLYIGGWYDTYTRSTVENFVALRRRQKAPVHLLMGPWHHGGAGQPTAGDASFLQDGGLPDYEAVRLQWFDQFLRGMPTGLEKEPAVRYFVMGGGPGPQAQGKTILHGGVWRSAESWPPPGARPTPFYFHADGTLRLQSPEDERGPTTFIYDPSDPVPTIGGQLSAIDIPAGAFDQRNDSRFPGSRGKMPLSARRDVLVFATPPLEEAVEIAGPVRVKLWVSTDAPDTDFTAKLMDVYPPGPNYPDGCALNLTDSICRLRFRNGFETEALAEPGQMFLPIGRPAGPALRPAGPAGLSAKTPVYELEFELYPTANLFAEGHRIRVDISSSNYPRFELNPNTGGPLGVERRVRVAENSIYHSRSRPSHMVLSVIKR